jgi:Thiol:disulfide interchange protein DsbD, N-terminal
MKKAVNLAVVLAFGLAAMAAQGQGFGANRSTGTSDAVQYLFPEQVTVPAGKASPVTLHFRIAQGLHINSHTPSEDYLIPTVFSIPGDAGVKLQTASYPAGSTLILPMDPKTKLNVYTGDFIIHARIVAAGGNHLVQAKLHYQACNQTQCMPPTTISAAIDVIGK